MAEKEDILFTRSDLSEFFSECSVFMRTAPMNSPNKYTPVKYLLRLVGLLKISRESFSLLSSPTKEFTDYIICRMTNYLDNIMASVTEDEWVLFKNGLATIVCIHLLSQASASPDLVKNNCAALDSLARISSRNKVEDIANTILERLDDLKRPISNLCWHELLTLVSSDRIRLDHLKFNRSFDSYLTCIGKFSRELALDKNFKQNVAQHFDDLVHNNHFPSMFI